ncbi:MAG: rRNA maturation RNase YbeY [Candidatus Sungbacteria bacterium RIFCSPLOWO2_01_FULL_59_16]|uniref:Endoribonuclease YbeY n=1 Tax=Candidatus Sungbacteria bacterium RIFCSPLOWO2_01_FULL_59_16 TaxID=1802280 RepID=A0A1G2L9C2_9BACT|nr:MAG: rRNA maturation RNase YbeY [Candidatus Sungbacteria bacterium RIFCSPLOWO2_01_FULL_59_16]
MTVLVVNQTKIRIPAKRITRIAAGLLREFARRGWRKFRAYDLAIVFMGDRESGILHQRFFRKSKPANVLSFDYGSAGEIILAPGVIRHEAREARESFAARLLRLLIHGFVHLAGIHHEKSHALLRRADALEAACARRFGLIDSAGISPPARRGRGRKSSAKHIRRH